MKPVQFYISEILREVTEMMKSISANVFPENRPVVSDAMDDMVVVSFPYGFEDKHVCQVSDIHFELIVRNKHNGIPNVEKLQGMLNQLVGLFPIVRDRYVLSRPSLALKGSDNTGFTIWLVQADIRVNTTDRYNFG